MDADFWHQRWARNEIGFHNPDVNPLLLKHFEALDLKPGSRIFLPLCGKSLDIAWLLTQGLRVVGAELSALAIEQLFSGLRLPVKITSVGKLKLYRGKNIDIFVGDIFDLSATTLGPVDAIYDRAALVALPAETRNRYTDHLRAITHNAPQLLISFEYDQAAMDGPPFSVSNDEIKQHYQSHYGLTLLASVEVAGGLKGKCPAKENVWLLQK